MTEYRILNILIGIVLGPCRSSTSSCTDVWSTTSASKTRMTQCIHSQQPGRSPGPSSHVTLCTSTLMSPRDSCVQRMTPIFMEMSQFGLNEGFPDFRWSSASLLYMETRVSLRWRFSRLWKNEVLLVGCPDMYRQVSVFPLQRFSCLWKTSVYSKVSIMRNTRIRILPHKQHICWSFFTSLQHFMLMSILVPIFLLKF